MILRFHPWLSFVRAATPYAVLALLCGVSFPLVPRRLMADDASIKAVGQPAAAGAISSEAQIARQLEQLGDPSFAVRERATRNLIEAGILVRPALDRLIGDPDAEVRARARQVLNVVRETDFRFRLKAFESDTTGKLQYDLPSWERFRREIGESREARELFVTMQRAEAPLLETLADNPAAITVQLADRCQAAQSALYLQMRDESGGSATVTAGTVAALLFVAGAEEVHIDEQEAINLDGLVRFRDFEEELKTGTQSANCRRLLGRWVAKYATPNTASQNLTLAFHFQLKEGAELARRMLANNEGPVEAKSFALLAIGRFGNADDVPMLQRFFSDARVCVRHRGGFREVQTQIRDLALAVSLHLTQQELKPYGLTHVVSNPQTLFLPNTVWFNDDTTRDAAFKKWTDWQAGK